MAENWQKMESKLYECEDCVHPLDVSTFVYSGKGSAQVGHHDQQGGGNHPTSCNVAHGSPGCSKANLQCTGGNGLFYCFVIN